MCPPWAFTRSCRRVIRHGGDGSEQAWSAAPDRSDWHSVKHRLIVWEYEARHEYGNSSRTWDHSSLCVNGRWIERKLRNTLVPLGVPIEIGGDELPTRCLQMVSEELRSSPMQDPEMLENLLQLFWHDIERHVIAGRVSERLTRAWNARADLSRPSSTGRSAWRRQRSRRIFRHPTFAPIFHGSLGHRRVNMRCGCGSATHNCLPIRTSPSSR